MLFALLGLAGGLFVATAAAAAEPGWRLVDLPASGSRAWRYLPESAPAGARLPVVVFLHGSGANPEVWRPYLREPAEATGAVVIAPAPADDVGWGIADDAATIAEAVDRVDEELHLDRRRIGLAGHSAGGAYAYFLAYSTRGGFSGVFSFSAPFRYVLGAMDPAYTPPLLLWYGAQDPNYTSGHFQAIAAMVEHRGIPWQAEIVQGLGHNDVRQQDLTAGFAFLAAQRYPLPNRLLPKSERAGAAPGPGSP